jgi:hypothetical protein
MISLQSTITYNGDRRRVPGAAVTIAVSIERFVLSVNETEDGVALERRPIEPGTGSVQHELSSSSYRVTLSDQAALGPGDGAINEFVSFYSYARERIDFLDLISRQVGVHFLLFDGVTIGSAEFDALIVPMVSSTDTQRLRRRLVDRGQRALLLLHRAPFVEAQGRLQAAGVVVPTPTLLELVSQLTNVAKTGPTKRRLTAADRRGILASLTAEGVDQADIVLGAVEEVIPHLYDFPLVVPSLRAVDIQGRLKLVGPAGAEILDRDFTLYHLTAEYVKTPGDQPTVLRHDFSPPLRTADGAVSFSLTDDTIVVEATVKGLIQIRAIGFDGTVAWERGYLPDDSTLANLDVVVPLQRPTQLSPDNGAASKRSKRLRGQVLDLQQQCPVKQLTVVIQAKENATSTWRIVGAATTDAVGNFSMPYPFGVYLQAQALTSLSPNEPVDLRMRSAAPNDETIAYDFLYLAVTDADCHHQPGDPNCDCHDLTGASRLPDQSDLINSDEYSQDIGGSCMNLSNPNRTLSEFNYQAIVRTSDPDVADATLHRATEAPANDPSGTVTNYLVIGAREKRARRAIDLDNPVKWTGFEGDGDVATMTQAVTVATGHLLHYKSTFKADGYSLGDLVYSLPLAPGQKKEIVVFDSSHALTGAETQEISQAERIAADLTSERLIATQLGGSISESLRGSSTATTSGVSAGLGVGAIIGPVGAVLGVSGGVSNANSSAAQDSSRNLGQAFSELLRQSIMQNAESYRQLNASVVTTVQEGQRYGVTSEVIANHNHCHALTVMYFEVLRHFAIFQELADVEECLFVPLNMTSFTRDNIHKWRDVLSRHLLPLPSDTYLQLGVGDGSRPGQHPLLKAFDANDRIRTSYAHVDFPAGSYDQEPVNFIKGDIDLRVNLPRPRTRYDRILSLPITSKTVTTTSIDPIATAKRAVHDSILAGATGGLSVLFGGAPGTNIEYKTEQHQVLVKQAIFDAFMTLDANFQTVPPARCIRVTNFAPASISFGGITVPVSGLEFFHEGVVDEALWTSYAKLLGYTDVLSMLNYYFRGRLIAEWDNIFYNDIAPVVLERILSKLTISDINCDFTAGSRYKGGERRIRLNVNGTMSKSRRDLPLRLRVECPSADAQPLKEHLTLHVESVRLHYSTAHYNGLLFSGAVQDDLLDGSDLHIPLRSDEKRNPRMEDRHLVDKLIEHLNSHLEHYNKAVWANLDADRRHLLLDGFSIHVYDSDGTPIQARSLASVVKNSLITITGNSLVFPVAPGYKVSQSFLTVTDDDTSAAAALLEHYQPLTPIPPYRISVPSKGVFAEALQGACNACERIETERLQDWERFPILDEPTTIAPITTPVPAITDWKAALAELSPPVVNIQNAPALPAPAAGLAGVSELLGKSDVFADVTGLEKNQDNAIRTYLSNQENARAFAQMAAGMAMQAHNTRNSAKIMDQLTAARNSGALTQEEYGKLVNQHLQQQIDGGATGRSQPADDDKTGSSLARAAVDAAAKGQSVKANKVDSDGSSESIAIEDASDLGVGGGGSSILGFIEKLVLGAAPHAAQAPIVTFDPQSGTPKSRAAYAKMLVDDGVAQRQLLDDYINKFRFDKAENPAIRGSAVREPYQELVPVDFAAVEAVATTMKVPAAQVLALWIYEGKDEHNDALHGGLIDSGVAFPGPAAATYGDRKLRYWMRSVILYKAFGSDRLTAYVRTSGENELEDPDGTHRAKFRAGLQQMKAASVPGGGGWSTADIDRIDDYFGLIGGAFKMDSLTTVAGALQPRARLSSDSLASWLWLQNALFEVYRHELEAWFNSTYGTPVDLSTQPWVTYAYWNGQGSRDWFRGAASPQDAIDKLFGSSATPPAKLNADQLDRYYARGAYAARGQSSAALANAVLVKYLVEAIAPWFA